MKKSSIKKVPIKIIVKDKKIKVTNPVLVRIKEIELLLKVLKSEFKDSLKK